MIAPAAALRLSTFPHRLPLLPQLFAALLVFGLSWLTAPAARADDDLLARFTDPPPAASPRVFWHWYRGCVSREAITADLEAMKRVGIGGAFLLPIKGPGNPPLMDPPVVQLTPEWWEMVLHALREADRLDLEIAMHACDGFAVAGGPWITPELSMQKLTWSITHVDGSEQQDIVLPQPPTGEDYYRDIAVLAFPSLLGTGENSRTSPPVVTTSRAGEDAGFLSRGERGKRIRMDKPGWIEFDFGEPFLCRTVTTTPDGNNYQCHRLTLEASDDGNNYHEVCRLTPPRHGWQNGDGTITHAIEPTRARFFRFVFDPAGSEPGAEDLDIAKWSPVLKVRRIELSSEPRIHQFRGKNGEVWRVSERTTSEQVPDADCVPLEAIVDLSAHLTEDGRLDWHAPEGKWAVLRIGHTSTGAVNATGGGGLGLECDKLNPEAVRLQFDRWFGEILRRAGPELAGRVLKGFLIDSWECGSQNWTPAMRDQFRRRRGYDPLPYLPTVAGVPVASADRSERFLFDLRTTIDEMLSEYFFATMAELSHRHGCSFGTECVAPTMVADGMRHFAYVDFPTGEFWLRSPTHDKPNDMRDAISAAHIYGKPIVQAEAFTELRMQWDEHPGMLKLLGDLQYCLGANRFAYHVFVQNPWPDRRPGMTLDNLGLFFQRDQTWWDAGRAWVDYARRCQALLQVGIPVVDIAVVTGEEIPSRAVLPERLTTTLPGLFGRDALDHEERRMANVGTPVRELPPGVKSSANIAGPDNLIDPLGGYAYDSINPDAIVRLASASNGKVHLDGGAEYALLVLPGTRPMSPSADRMTPELARKLTALVRDGANLLVCEPPRASPSLAGYPEADATVLDQWKALSGNARVLKDPLQIDSLSPLGIEPDVVVEDEAGQRTRTLAWTHRRTPVADLYFFSNQEDEPQELEVSVRQTGRIPEIWDPLTGEAVDARTWTIADGRTTVPLRFEPHGSLFLVFRKKTAQTAGAGGNNWLRPVRIAEVDGPWNVRFAPKDGGPTDPVQFAELSDWSRHAQDDIRHYSGTAVYETTFQWSAGQPGQRFWLDLGGVGNLALIELNGVDCGTAWAQPLRVEITEALRPGQNTLRIAVTNTWYNRLVGEARQPDGNSDIWTLARTPSATAPLKASGLLGPVEIVADQAP